MCGCGYQVWACFLQSEIGSMTVQLEDLDGKQSSGEKAAKNLKELVEELQDQVAEETRAKIAASNKQKQLQDEVERVNGQLEDEEEAKDSLQAKLANTNSQVSVCVCVCGLKCIWDTSKCTS